MPERRCYTRTNRGRALLQHRQHVVNFDPVGADRVRDQRLNQIAPARRSYSIRSAHQYNQNLPVGAPPAARFMLRLFNISRTIHRGEGAAPTVFFCTSAHQYNQNLPAGAPPAARFMLRLFKFPGRFIAARAPLLQYFLHRALSTTTSCRSAAPARLARLNNTTEPLSISAIASSYIRSRHHSHAHSSPV